MASEPQDEARLIHPYQTFDDPNGGMKDFGPRPVSADAEVAEVEQVITPVPKDESAQESADSSASQPKDVQPASETPVQPSVALPLPTDKLEAAVKASGKDSGSSEDEPPTQPPVTPSPASSSPSSSSPTSPGVPMPPAPPKPPTSD